MDDDRAVREHAERVDSLIGAVQAFENEELRTVALDALEAMSVLYGQALARIVSRLDSVDRELVRGLAADELVGHLLLLHELHRPEPPRGVPGSAGQPASPSPALVTMGPTRRRATAGDGGVSRVDQREPLGTHAREPDGTRCELCGEPADEAHRHLVDLATRRLLCACRACALLFDRTDAASRYRLVPRQARAVPDARLPASVWARLGVPVDLAFVLSSTGADRIVAIYPGALGATEAEVPRDAWRLVEALNPGLASVRPDVEAVLVRRTGEHTRCWIVPVDRCYELVGLVRTTWRGQSGGPEVWLAIDRFLDGLGGPAGTGEEAWRNEAEARSESVSGSGART